MNSQRLAFLGVGAIVLALVAYLAFGFFGIQSAFLDDEVDEANPFETTETADGEATDGEPPEDSEEFDEAMEEAEANPTEVDETMVEMEDEIVTLASGAFSGTSRYTVEGEAVVLNDGSETRFLRFENFESSNGPDLNVYLRAADGDFIDLGDLKGNIGDQNYEIPVGVDLSVYSEVQIWCVRFGVNFGSANLG